MLNKFFSALIAEFIPQIQKYIKELPTYLKNICQVYKKHSE